MGRIGKGLLSAWLLIALSAIAQEPQQGAREAAPSEALEQARERDAMEPRVTSVGLDGAATGNGRKAGGDRVMDQLDLDRTEITGNQELPRVLYIVPWQKSDPGDLMGRPVNSLLDEVLAPLDREEFIRQVGYYSDLYGVTGEKE